MHKELYYNEGAMYKTMCLLRGGTGILVQYIVNVKNFVHLLAVSIACIKSKYQDRKEARMLKEDDCVRCPYYTAEQQRQLRCEGLTPGSRLSLYFNGDRKMSEYKKTFCLKRWRSCRIVRMLDQKYEEEG